MMNLNGVILYRGETPGTVGFDVHGGYGETWTVDPDHAAAYARGPDGYLKRAILPATAKRLVLAFAGTDGYSEINWDGIEELQRIAGEPYLRRTLQVRPLYEAWHEEMTLALVEAGYDSIATTGAEGP